MDKGNYASLGTDGLFEAIRSQSLATTLVVPQQQKTVQAKKTSGNTRQQAGHKSLKPVAVKVEKVGSPKTETSKQETGKETPKAEKLLPARQLLQRQPHLLLLFRHKIKPKLPQQSQNTSL